MRLLGGVDELKLYHGIMFGGGVVKKLKREVKAYIEAEIKGYHESKQDLLELREDMINESPSFDGESGGQTYKIGRPTEMKAIRLITNKRLKRLEQTVRAIEMVLSSLPECQYRLVELKYWQRPQRYTDDGIAEQVGCSRSTLYRYIDGIVRAIAVEMGLIDDVMAS